MTHSRIHTHLSDTECHCVTTDVGRKNDWGTLSNAYMVGLIINCYVE